MDDKTLQESNGVLSLPGRPRWRVGWDSGEVFETDQDFDGRTLVIELVDGLNPVLALHAIEQALDPALDQHPMPGDWHWWASFNGGEWFAVGPCASREEVIAEAIGDGSGEYQAEDGSWRHSFVIEEARDQNVDLARWFDVDSWLERAAEDMDDDHSGSNEDGSNHPIEEIGKEAKADLERSICRAIRAWQRRHKLPLRSCWFLDTRHNEEVDLPAERAEDVA